MSKLFFASARLLAALSLAPLLAACGGSTSKPPDGTAAKPAIKTEVAAEPRVLYYYDPMRPEVHFDKPGQSPFMAMDLVPKLAAEEIGSGVAVSAAVVESLGIRTALPVRQDVRQRIRVPARVVADARGQARLQSRVNGWVERLVVRSVGQSVAAGSVVAEVYSPELVQAQDELLLGAETVGPATERLRRFGIADGDIQAIRRAGKVSRRLPLRAPVSGVVTELGVREGSSISPDSVIVDLSPSSAVWVEAALFPAQKLSLGDSVSARFSIPGLPGREWRSDSGNAVPVVDPVTQTLALRFSIDAATDLPLGTVLDAQIDGKMRTGLLLIPGSAVIRTAQGDRVLMEHGKNRFAPMAVKLGERFDDQVEVLEGVAATDRIVVSGQFLLDAEANQQSGLSRMDGHAP
jgi:Cu(I)/Ag(I) efflux system membrane fusion protein